MKEMVQNGLLHKNPLLMYAIGICPIVAVTTTLKRAVAVSVITAIITVVVCVCANLFLKLLPAWIRTASYFLLAAALLIPAELLVNLFLPQTSQSLGIFLPLLAVNTLYLYRSEGFSRKNTLGVSAADALATSVGYALGACVTGGLRELLARASIWDIPLPFLYPISGFARPFGGFILLGMVAALFAAVSNFVYAGRYADEETNSVGEQAALSAQEGTAHAE